MTRSASDYLPGLAAACRAATRTALDGFRQAKSAGNVVTKYGGEVQLAIDRAASAAIATSWATTLAGIPYVDEEIPATHTLIDDRTGRLIGLADPLDGTGTYQLDDRCADGAPIGGWGNTLGVLQDGQVLAGIMAQPGRRQLFYGAWGETGCHWLTGADFDRFLDTGELATGTILYRSPDERPVDASQALVLSMPKSSKMSTRSLDRTIAATRNLCAQKLLGNERMEGCAVGNAALVLLGGSAAYINIGGGTAWDLAVPGFLLELAGGAVARVGGGDITWSQEKTPVIFARDPFTLERLLPHI